MHNPDLRIAARERPVTSTFRTLGAEGPGIGMDNLSYFESAEFLEGAILEAALFLGTEIWVVSQFEIGRG